MLRSTDGGYDPDRGFVPRLKGNVADLLDEPAGSEGNDQEPLTQTGRWVTLAEHTRDVVAAQRQLAAALGVPAAEAELLDTAASWHDVGKVHEAFQRGIGAQDNDGPWAKSDRGGRPDYRTLDAEGNTRARPGFRHELASALAWLEHAGPDFTPEQRDRVAWMIAAHHGRVRLGLRALPHENEPPAAAGQERLFARGVWHGDALPALELDGLAVPETVLRLHLMQLGQGPQGPSWSERMHRLLQAEGPFALAWLETLLRIADWRASALEDAQGPAP
jgi:CRISPR-associated endonuclease/helicase Cas3